MTLEGISITDWVLFGCLLFSTLVGAWRGLLFEVLSLFVWLFAFLAAQWWTPAVVQAFTKEAGTHPLYYGVAFAMVFIAVAFAAGLLVQMIKKFTDAIGLRPVDRALGSVFGFLRGVILLLAVTVMVHLTPLAKAQAWQVSVGASWLSTLLVNLKPFLPQAFGSYLG